MLSLLRQNPDRIPEIKRLLGIEPAAADSAVSQTSASHKVPKGLAPGPPASPSSPSRSSHPSSPASGHEWNGNPRSA